MARSNIFVENVCSSFQNQNVSGCTSESNCQWQIHWHCQWICWNSSISACCGSNKTHCKMLVHSWLHKTCCW